MSDEVEIVWRMYFNFIREYSFTSICFFEFTITQLILTKDKL